VRPRDAGVQHAAVSPSQRRTTFLAQLQRNDDHVTTGEHPDHPSGAGAPGAPANTAADDVRKHGGQQGQGQAMPCKGQKDEQRLTNAGTRTLKENGEITGRRRNAGALNGLERKIGTINTTIKERFASKVRKSSTRTKK
jgi:hypothetical protein